MVSLGEPHYLISRSNFLSPVTPEKLLTQEFQSLLDGLFDEEQLNLLVVDEVGFLNNVSIPLILVFARRIAYPSV